MFEKRETVKVFLGDTSPLFTGEVIGRAFEIFNFRVIIVVLAYFGRWEVFSLEGFQSGFRNKAVEGVPVCVVFARPSSAPWDLPD